MSKGKQVVLFSFFGLVIVVCSVISIIVYPKFFAYKEYEGLQTEIAQAKKLFATENELSTTQKNELTKIVEEVAETKVADGAKKIKNAQDKLAKATNEIKAEQDERLHSEKELLKRIITSSKEWVNNTSEDTAEMKKAIQSAEEMLKRNDIEGMRREQKVLSSLQRD
ncbi:hypothetical protein SAMN02745116_02123 [Pilibacter termitis]|uniref:Uncharacterized protein n=1 Tax=Pilibacter termitis TaxID=263852 RepID=A0A1T4Q9Z2_9ENTE|nr:hypothetical protein [Pilibacter termitis]SKA00610.1 hypothetical protein SAMN02745116_02123 [Pilibacter termitis]